MLVITRNSVASCSRWDPFTLVYKTLDPHGWPSPLSHTLKTRSLLHWKQAQLLDLGRRLTMTWKALVPLLYILHIVLAKSHAVWDSALAPEQRLFERSYTIGRPRRKVLYRRAPPKEQSDTAFKASRQTSADSIKHVSDTDFKAVHQPSTDSFKHEIDSAKLTSLHHISDPDTQEKLHSDPKIDMLSTHSFKRPVPQPPKKVSFQGDHPEPHVESHGKKEEPAKAGGLGTIHEHSGEVPKGGTSPRRSGEEHKQKHPPKHQPGRKSPDSSGSSHGTGASGSVRAPGGHVHFTDYTNDQHMEYLRRKFKLKKHEIAAIKAQPQEARERVAETINKAPWHERNLPSGFKKFLRFRHP